MTQRDFELEELHKKLWKHIENQAKHWKSFVYAKEKGFYQGFEEIKIDGWRPSEKRFERYGIEKYLSKTMTALDIGSNCGFFTLVVSRYVNHIDGVELNPHLVAIANDTKEFLKIQNAMFLVSSFEEFTPNKKYDVVFSLANDETIDGNTKFIFKEYMEKINRVLSTNGLVMFETVSPDTYEPKLFNPKLEFIKRHFDVLEDKMVDSEYPVNVPQRRFLILRKKET
ncbi:MAG: methyltransferase domain-containing protein [Candidatus Nitrosotenuis sp.]